MLEFSYHHAKYVKTCKLIGKIGMIVVTCVNVLRLDKCSYQCKLTLLVALQSFGCLFYGGSSMNCLQENEVKLDGYGCLAASLNKKNKF